ncbi:hypothetical protein Golob_020176, partial [Gossypium lobatum]|nr:hypothetical protein [Gossypium lobatum]
RLIVAVAFFFLTFFFVIPIAIVQSLANIESIEKALPFLKPIIEVKVIKSFIQGFLPGIALKIFLLFLPTILMIMSKFEGFISLSALERRSAIACVDHPVLLLYDVPWLLVGYRRQLVPQFQ